MPRLFAKDLAQGASLGVGTMGAAYNGVAALAVHALIRASSFDVGVNDNRVLTFYIGANLSGLSLNVNGASTVLRAGGRSGTGDAFQVVDHTASAAHNQTNGAGFMSVGAILDFAGDTITVFFNGIPVTGAVTFANTTYTDSSASRTNHDGLGGTLETTGVNSSTTAAFAGHVGEVALWWTVLPNIADFAEMAAGVPALSNNIVPPDRFWSMEQSGTQNEIGIARNGTVLTMTGAHDAQIDYELLSYSTRARSPSYRLARRYKAGTFKPAWAMANNLIGGGYGV